MSAELDTHTTEALREPQYDAVVALGKNWRLPIEGSRIDLSIESKMTAIAAGQMYADGLTKKIIFSTGETAGIDKTTGLPYPTEAEEMKRFMRIFFSEEEIPEDAIVTETKSFDTAGNAEEVKKILDEYNLRNIAVLTIGSHDLRAKRLFKNYGVKTTAFASQNILKGRNPHYDKLVHEYNWSTRHGKELVKETILNAELLVDPRGERLRKLTKKTRNRAS